MKSRIVIIAALLLSLLGGGLFSLQGSQATSVSDYCIKPVDYELLTLINNYRAANGLKPLVPDQRLGAAAEHHSMDMSLTWTWSHTLSDGTTWLQNIINHGYTSSGRGENIAWGYTSVQRTFDAWKSSSSHNAAMLNSGYGAIGLSLVINGDGDWHEEWAWTNTFGPKVEEPVVVCGQPTNTPTNTPLPPTATATLDPSIPTATPTEIPPTATATATSTPEPTATPKPCRGKGKRAC